MATLEQNAQRIINCFQGMQQSITGLETSKVDNEVFTPVAQAAYLNYPEWQPETTYKAGDLIKIRLGNGDYARAECLKDFTSGANIGNVPWSADMDAGNIVAIARCGIIQSPVEYDKLTGISPDVWSVKNYVNNILVKVGANEDLTTTAKETLVAAINEVKSSIDGIDLSAYATTVQLNAEKVRINAIETAIGGFEKEIQDFIKTI